MNDWFEGVMSAKVVANEFRTRDVLSLLPGKKRDFIHFTVKCITSKTHPLCELPAGAFLSLLANADKAEASRVIKLFPESKQKVYKALVEIIRQFENKEYRELIIQRQLPASMIEKLATMNEELSSKAVDLLCSPSKRATYMTKINDKRADLAADLAIEKGRLPESPAFLDASSSMFSRKKPIGSRSSEEKSTHSTRPIIKPGGKDPAG